MTDGKLFYFVELIAASICRQPCILYFCYAISLLTSLKSTKLPGLGAALGALPIVFAGPTQCSCVSCFGVSGGLGATCNRGEPCRGRFQIAFDRLFAPSFSSFSLLSSSSSAERRRGVLVWVVLWWWLGCGGAALAARLLRGGSSLLVFFPSSLLSCFSRCFPMRLERVLWRLTLCASARVVIVVDFRDPPECYVSMELGIVLCDLDSRWLYSRFLQP
jgi:hypothetical protein